MVIQTPTLHFAPINSGAGFGTGILGFCSVVVLLIAFFFWWKHDVENAKKKNLSSNPQFFV